MFNITQTSGSSVFSTENGCSSETCTVNLKLCASTSKLFMFAISSQTCIVSVVLYCIVLYCIVLRDYRRVHYIIHESVTEPEIYYRKLLEMCFLFNRTASSISIYRIRDDLSNDDLECLIVEISKP